MTEEEKRKLIILIYFLWKGSHQIKCLHDEFSRRDSDDEIKEAMNKENNLFQAIARFDDMYLYSEDETENEEIQKLEDEIYEWIEDYGFTEDIKKYFDKNSIMFS
jgi:Ser-tRNA(Ala) deacylase AlaX